MTTQMTSMRDGMTTIYKGLGREIMKGRISIGAWTVVASILT